MKNKGLSLIEILMVIAIIAVTSAIVYPVLAKAKMASKATAVKLNLKGMWTGLQLYREQNGDNVELGSIADMGLPIPPGGITRFWQDYTHDELFTWDKHRGLVPCGITVGSETMRGIFYMGNVLGVWDDDVSKYKDKTVILFDKNCNTSDVKVDCQYCDKRSIAITLGGQILDRRNSEELVFLQRFYQK